MGLKEVMEETRKQLEEAEKVDAVEVEEYYSSSFQKMALILGRRSYVWRPDYWWGAS